MNHLRNTITAVAAATALTFLAGCGDVQAPANDIGGAVEDTGTPTPRIPVRTDPNRLDFGDGEAILPPEPRRPRDTNRARLDFGDEGRG